MRWRAHAVSRPKAALNLNSEIETADSADFTDFEGGIGDEPTNPFVAKAQGIDSRNLLYPPYVICGSIRFRFLG
jgi:hypothetical protein